MIKKLLPAGGILLALSSPAYAHLNPAEHGSFMAGATHPLFGLDHLLVMVAVGLWAAQEGRKAIVALPASFVAMMLLGFGLALTGMALPYVEPVILSSVVGLGLLVALAIRLPIGACMMIVGTFALFHGHAHGGEIGSAGALAYGAGFALATALLHGCGIVIGRYARASRNSESPLHQMISRALGGLTVLAGAALILG
ncbi:HupE/UreJ family protein [Aestuariispira insulae]|uniref:Urease accessory protein n=1 Tax=Aestuariispira insulae TaxID=1461337 RepID=A0A3D9H9G5_9PROT|nr:HupE/UreJ family protein [Aestuariispira insulae]RED46128.1 urease accessory protein [Aestuariispira insulae]